MFIVIIVIIVITMHIFYKFYGESDYIITHVSFERLKQINSNYDEIESIICYENELETLPMLPKKLKILDCSKNKLTTLPDLPNTLVTLKCEYNKLTYLPVLPTGIKTLCCYTNQLTFISKLPSTLEELFCDNNKLTLLPVESVELHTFRIDKNPVYYYIQDYCNGSIDIYHNENKVFANKIASWFLECKYNPHYKYCRDRVNSGYDKLFE
jgi:Leucine-rich repeat (LRR) protein